MLGIIPPFMDLDVNILDKIETDIIDKIKQVPIQKFGHLDERHFDLYTSYACSVFVMTCVYMFMMMRSTIRG